MDSENTLLQSTFPPKPQWTANNNSWLRGIISFLLFIGSFYFLINDDLLYLAILVGVLLIHELGHYLAMKQFGYTDVRILFIPLFGAAAIGETKNVNQLQRAIILLAGPLPGILAGIILIVLGVIQEQKMIVLIAEIFIFLNVFNLFPLIPLDGGNLIETLFFSKARWMQLIFLILSIIGFVVYFYYTGSKFIVVLPIYLASGMIHKFNTYKIRKKLQENGISCNKAFEDLTDEEYWLIRKQMILDFKAFNTLDENDFTNTADDKRLAVKMRSIVYPEIERSLNTSGKLLITLVWVAAIITPVITVKQLEGRASLFLMMTDKEREKMVVDCMTGLGELGVNYPSQSRNYCNCAFDTLMKRFSLREFKQHQKLKPEVLHQLYNPHLERCRQRYKLAIEGDSMIVEFNY